jgi:3'-phosphoadenosine 5'-phosphosulfate sulfotransferase (PAPS reductase)/FAD synthetase
MNQNKSKRPVRHLLGLSGGKDSSALAIYMRDKVPEMEYFFADTGAELPETLEFIDLLEDYLGKEIVKLNADRDFDFYLKLHNNFLPSPQRRWCTINLKLIPFEDYVGEDEVISYIAIRADEPSRVGYTPTKSNIQTRFPFREDGLGKDDILCILESSGIGIPKYYNWRSRSGCYFCFFQRQEEWLGLKKNHEALFKLARQYEKYDEATGKRYTWNQSGSLDEIVARAEKKANQPQKLTATKSKKLIDNIANDDDDDFCPICML